MNIEADQAVMSELEHAFRFNDAVLRHLTIKTKAAVTAPSAMMKEEKSRSLTGEAAEGGKEAAAPAAAESAGA